MWPWRKNPAVRGFTLLELVIVLAVMTVLAGVLVPIVKQILDSAKVTKVTALVDSLTNACRRYYKDTRKFAKEYGASVNLEDHQLAYDQSAASTVVKDWNGPYIEGPLTNAVLPFEGASIELRPTLAGVGAGYQLAGLAGPVTQSNIMGQEVWISPLTQRWVDKINEAFDGTGEGADAGKIGRVVFLDQGTGSYELCIFVLDPLGTAK